MLTQDQRNTIANQIASLQKQLLPYRELLFREAPHDLQKQIRAQNALGAITSGGLESVVSILDRMTWAVYYLKNPDFPENDNPKPAPKSVEAQPVPIQRAPQAAKPSSTAIDFGPFDPRKGTPS